MSPATRSSDTSSMYKLRQGALYLNNVGCALLEQGAYQAAMETLKDAVSILKVICTPCSTTLNPVSQMDESIRNANQRIALPHKFGATPPLPTIGLMTLEDYRYFKFDSQVLYYAGGGHTLLCPIRFHEDDASFNDNDLHSATVLYNLGLSHACLALCSIDAKVREHLRKAASRLFKLSDSVLQHCLDESDRLNIMHGIDDESKIQRIATVNIAVLHTMIQFRTDEMLVDDDNNNQVFYYSNEQVMDRLFHLQHTAFLDHLADFCPMEQLHAPAA